MKEDLNKWKHILCPYIARVNIKMAILVKDLYKSNAIPMKIPMAFFCRNGNAYPQIDMEFKRVLNSQNNIEKEKQTRRLTIPNFKTK